MSQPIEVSPLVRVPADALSFKAVRSGGPGGQNVNKVASKVELRVDLSRVEGLRPTQRARLLVRAEGRLDAEGQLLVTSQRTRDQLVNLEDARDKVRALIAASLPEPKPRRATKPTRGSKERRLRDKRARSDVKKGRSGKFDD